MKLVFLFAGAVGVVYLLIVVMLRIIAILPSIIAEYSFKLGPLDFRLPYSKDTINIDGLLYDDKNVDKNVLRYVMVQYYEDSDLYLINYKKNRDKYKKIAEENLKDSNKNTRDTTISFISYYIEALGRERYFNTIVNRFKILCIILFVFMVNLVVSFTLMLWRKFEVVTKLIDDQRANSGVISKYFVKIVDFLSSHYYLGTFLSLSLGILFVMIIYIIILNYINRKEVDRIKNEVAKLKTSQDNTEAQEDKGVKKDTADKIRKDKEELE